jgi:putative component of membrane protein insertase Oxa1/YidC/SpoIIIJ protein YidD
MIKKIYDLARIFKHSLFVSVFGFTTYCKHSPSCSQYTTEEIRQSGFLKGGVKGIKRILKCY